MLGEISTIAIIYLRPQYIFAKYNLSSVLFDVCLHLFDHLTICFFSTFEDSQIFAFAFEAIVRFELSLRSAFNPLPVNAGG